MQNGRGAISRGRFAVNGFALIEGAAGSVSPGSDGEGVAVVGQDRLGDICWSQGNGCAGDIRLNNCTTNGYGLARPVLFTARDGATISGHVWATVAGPAKRPGIVITNGSVQANEQLYWFAAQTLAKAGYVVLTFDPQGQGQSAPRASPTSRNGIGG